MLANRFVGNRYTIHHEIGHGSFSIVYEALDTLENRAVAVKTLNYRGGRERLLRLQHEVSILTDLDHLNIVKNYAFESEGPAPYLVMELISGTTLKDYLLSQGRLPIDTALSIITQVVEAIYHVHGKGIIHRDLKPSNIMIAGGVGGSQTVKVLDFGLAWTVSLADRYASRTVVGSFSYMAPEQTGVLQLSTDFRADLYSVGVIFYEMVTGDLPFKGDDATSLIHQHIAKLPASPRSLRPDVPPPIEEIILKLLKKDPRERYQTASGLLADLKKCQAMSLMGSEGFDFLIGKEDIPADVIAFHTQLVGRSRQMTELKEALETAANGEGCGLLAAGEPGIGKTRLANELRRAVSELGGLFVSGKCTEYTRAFPYAPFVEAIQEYVQQVDNLPLSRRSSTVNRLQSELGEMLAEVGKIIPDIQVLTGEVATLTSSTFERDKELERFLNAMSDFLVRLGDASMPVVVFLDDLQWLDRGSFLLLERTLPKLIGSHILFVGAYRDTEVDKGHPLLSMMQIWKDVLTPVILQPLSWSEVGIIAAELFPMDDQSCSGLADIVYERSLGNPFFTFEMLKALLDMKALSKGPDGWRLRKERVQDVSIALNVDQVILKRVTHLSPESAAVLGYAAVIGRHFNFEDILHLTDKPPAMVLVSLDEAIKHHLVTPRISPVGNKDYSFAHDKILEALYGRLEPKRKALLHHQFADYLEDRYKDRLSEVIFDLALHFTRGLDHNKALKYALEAGNLAQSSYANAEAASFYETVLRLLSEGFRIEGVDAVSLQIKVTEQLADVLVLLGKYENANRLYDQVLPVLTDGVEISRLHTKIGAVYFKQGNRSKTVEHFSLGLSALGIRQPTTTAGAVLSILQEAFIQIFHTYLPRFFVRRRVGKERPPDVAAMNLFQLLVSYYYFINMKFCFQIHLKQINLSERIGRPEFKKNAYSLHELLCNAVGMHRRALRYAMKAMELDDEVRRNRSIPGAPSGMIGEGALSGIGDSALLALGRAYYYMANYDRANEYLAKAADESMKLGNLWDAEVAIGHRCMADFGKGEFETMLDHATRLQHIAEGVNDVRGMGWGQVLLALVHSHLGNIDDALRHGITAVKHNESAGDQLITAMSLRVLGQVYLRAGNFSQAIETLRKSRQVIEQHQLIHDFLPGTYIVLCEAYIRAGRSDPALRRSNLKSAKWMLLVSELLARSFKNWRAQTKRIRALYETEMGRHDRGLTALEEGIAISSQLGSRFDLAQCYAATGGLLCITGDSRGMECIGKARKLFSDMKTRLDLSELEQIAGLTSKSGQPPQELESLDKQTAATTLRLTSLLRICQGISAILDVDTLLQQILQSAVSIVGAERGVLFLYEEGQLRIRMVHGLEPSGSLSNVNVSRSVIQRVERERQPMLTIDAQADPRFTLEESIHRYNMRSILCIPLTRGEKLLGVLYLDNRLIANLFTEQELELMVAFGAQAAIAIDNASAYRQLEDLTDTLEQRVRQRTEELRVQEREIARLQKEKIARFLPRNLADMIMSGEHEEFLKGHRRELTVVFIDLRGFTSFVEKTDPEEVMSILREYHAAMGHLVSEYGGTLERFIGDALMVYFNDPLPCPNHAQQAVKMAIGMRQAIYTLQQQWKKRSIELGAGIGIATGYATIGAVGFEDRLDYSAIGPVTNLAARLCSEAQHGQIIISDGVVPLLKDLITEPIGELVLKGIKKPIAVSQVVGLMP